MKLAAAYALAGLIPEKELCADRIIPEAFNERVTPAVAAAVAMAAIDTGVAKKNKTYEEEYAAVEKRISEARAKAWK